MLNSSIRLSVDIGGTFTDVVLENGDVVISTKVLTTYKAPENAIIEGMSYVCKKSGVDPSLISQIIHGTTLATNALIERRGAKTALITTKGFRDVIEMRTESRFEQYDLNLTLPDPLLPRNFRYTIEERMQADGKVLIPLNQQKLDLLINEIKAAGFESIAVGLLHSYANDTHERMIAKALAQRMPEAMVSLSSQVSPQMREYERFNTTIANAYIKPLMKSYLSRLKGHLAKEHANCPIFLMHSGGGIISLENAAEFPVRLIESGPAGGAVFAAHIAARHGLDKVLSFDMGGTTAKICLIKNQTPKTARVFEVARTYRFKKGSGMPISIPVIDMVEIGAGGGSLAQIDSMRQIRVGPESAGSEPGPACFKRHGTRPAVTDADLILGKLDPTNFAGGSISLDALASEKALKLHLGDPLEVTAQMAAFGLSEAVDENMANAARVHAVENGEDLSEFTMIAFGGAAPLHAGRLCEKLGIKRMLVPTGAGVGSAIGFLYAPFSFEANRSQFMRLSDFDAKAIKLILNELKSEATAFVRSCNALAPIEAKYKVYMRYSGQGWEIPVQLTKAQAKAPDVNTYQALFEREYELLFGRVVDGMDVEVTVWSVNATTPAQTVNPVQKIQTLQSLTTEKTRELFDPSVEAVTTAAELPRSTMKPGSQIAGPAIITEDETTVIVPASRIATALNDGSIDITEKERPDVS